MLLVKNAKFTHRNISEVKDILIAGGRIEKELRIICRSMRDVVIDGTGKIVTQVLSTATSM